MTLTERLEGLPKPAAIALGIAGVLLAGYADYLASYEVSFTLLYLGPIALVAWVVGRWPGLALSVLATASGAFTDTLTRPTEFHAQHPTVRYWNVGVHASVFFITTLLVAALRQQLDKEKAMARLDPLTRMANRRSFLESAALELERLRRYPRQLTVAYLDVDGFKEINDRRGHAAGDALLVAAAAILRAGTRPTDVVARLGGDEFALLLPETDGPTADAALKRLRERLRTAMQAGKWPVTFSVGMVTFLSAPENVDAMLRRADELMYAVKAAGKDSLRHEVVEGD